VFLEKIQSAKQSEMVNQIYKIEWKYSDAGTLNLVRPYLRKLTGQENISPHDIIRQRVLKSIQDNKNLRVYYERIKTTFNIDWNALKLDDFEDIHVDLAFMLATQNTIIESKLFPKIDDDCWVRDVLELGDEKCSGPDADQKWRLKQGLKGKTHLQLPLQSAEIVNNNYQLDFEFENTSGSEEFLTSFSVSKNCFDENGWSEWPSKSDNFVAVNSTSSSPQFRLNWCGSVIEDSNLCLTFYSTSEYLYPTVSFNQPTKTPKILKTLEEYTDDDYTDDTLIENIPCSKDIQPGNCWIKGTEANCKGIVDGCQYEQVNCAPAPGGKTVLVTASVGGGFIMILGVIAVIVCLITKKKARHPAEYVPPSNSRSAYDFK